MIIREYQARDFETIQKLNEAEGWTNLVEQHELTKNAWENSNVALVVEEEGEVVGFLRGLTNGHVTLFVCELLVKNTLRGKGIGNALLQNCHERYPSTRMELLASSTSKTYYEKLRFRPFYGYRKTIME